MVKIISRGKSRSDCMEKVFRCEICGCIFSTDVYSKDLNTFENPVIEYASNCPRCLSSCQEYYEEY